MFSDRVFAIALILSVITHGIILFQNPNLNLNILSKDKKEPLLELRYVKPPEEKKEVRESPKPKPAPAKNEPFLKLSSKVTAAKANPPPYIDREGIFKKTRENISPKELFNKPEFVKPDIISIKKKITLPPIDLDKIDNPSYISYYQIVREKIRRAAYQNYFRTETGEVYLSFLISHEGLLKDVRLVEEKSSPSAYLQEMALRSIKDASPFPSFPKELDYPQLSFNVVISFEVE